MSENQVFDEKKHHPGYFLPNLFWLPNLSSSVIKDLPNFGFDPKKLDVFLETLPMTNSAKYRHCDSDVLLNA